MTKDDFIKQNELHVSLWICCRILTLHNNCISTYGSLLYLINTDLLKNEIFLSDTEITQYNAQWKLC